jgi:tRNA nucleotidyltransferase (CCA-adding enzyme)
MRFLEIPPGPEIGEALRHLLDRVLEDPDLNKRETLEVELSTWWERRVLSFKPGEPGSRGR